MRVSALKSTWLEAADKQLNKYCLLDSNFSKKLVLKLCMLFYKIFIRILCTSKQFPKVLLRDYRNPQTVFNDKYL